MARFQPGQSGNPGGKKKHKPLDDAIELAISRIDDRDPHKRKRFNVLGEKIVRVALGYTDEDPANVRQARELLAKREGIGMNFSVSDPDGQPLGIGLVQEMEAALARARAAVAAIEAPTIEGEAVKV